MEEASYTTPFGRPDELKPLALKSGGWFLVLIASLTLVSSSDTLFVHLGLLCRHGLMQRLSLTAEPFLMGALIGSGVMNMFYLRARSQSRA